MPQTVKKRSTGKKAAKKPAAKRAKKKTTASRQPVVSREVWAGICLFFAFIGYLSEFSVKGFFLDWYRYAVGSLIGAGAAVLPFALTGAGALLLIHRKGKARLRCACALLTPVFFGSLRHLVLKPGAYAGGMAGFKALAADGRALDSGGWLAGGIAIVLRAAISKTGAMIFVSLMLVCCVFGALKLTPMSIWDWIRAHRPLPEPEEPEKPEAPASRSRSRTATIDVPLDDAVQRRTPDRNTGRGPVAPPNVPTPAEALRCMSQTGRLPDLEAEDKPSAAPPAEVPAADPLANVVIRQEEKPAEPVPVPAPEPAAPPVKEEPPVEKQIETAITSSGKPAYLYPPITLMKSGSGKPQGSEEAIRACAVRLVDTLQSFGVEADVVDITSGPTVTRYELQLQRGIKFSKVNNLADDIALALGATGVRVSTIPDKNAVGIEVPNDRQELVTARDIIASTAFKNGKSKLSFAVGKDITGAPVVGDIGKMPHMLIAGTTGSGKSVCINSLLMSILYKATPEEVRLIMVDPKMIELGVYNGIPHLLIPVVTDPRKAAGALNWAVGEMMKRYKLFSEVGARDLNGYNMEMRRRDDGEPLPRVVIVIDELSDLMVAARNEVEEAIIRIAQMARAAGMHLIIATQRPSADVITGLMKTNIPSRISFAVASAIDSRIILDQMGAEKLLGKGDMLYAPLGGGKPQRIQGCFVSDSEVEEVVNFVKQSGQPDYDEEIMDHIERQAEAAESGGTAPNAAAADGDDEMLSAAIEIVVDSGMASVSMLQRRLKLGYARAARLVDIMEERGIVGPFEGSKPRTVNLTKDQWKEMCLRKDSL